MKNKYLLFVLVAVLAFVDAICTLLNANPGYWSNYNDYGVEYNPLGAWALHQGPVVYLLFVAVWVFIIFILLKYLPRKIGAAVGTAFWIGHSILGLGTQGVYVVFSRLHVGTEDNWMPLFIFMMSLTVLNTIIFAYSLMRFLDHNLTPVNTHKRVSKKRI